jgi:hypothetical protein
MHKDPDFAFIDTYLALLAHLDEVLILNIWVYIQKFHFIHFKIAKQKVWKIAVGYEPILV